MARTMTAMAAARSVPEARATTVGWPAFGFVLLVIAAAVFSFSPRPSPVFAPTYVHPNGVLVNGLARSGTRLLAVGDLGTILLADAPTGPWHDAKIATQRGSALTQIAFIDDKTALAVGHDGWILRTEDRGESWTEVAFSADDSNPLLGIAGPYDGRIFVYGGFGELQKSDDAGRSWQKVTLDPPAPAKAAGPAKPVDPNAFPFGDTSSVASSEDRHLYALVRGADGSLLLAGERGLLERSRDHGEHWEALPSIYSGSFFGALPLKDRGYLVFGMRGNVFRSGDDGSHWAKIAVPTSGGLDSGAITPEGDVLLVGDAETLLRSRDDGLSFARVGDGGRRTLSTILPIDDTHWLTGGDNGIGVVTLAANGQGKNGTQP